MAGELGEDGAVGNQRGLDAEFLRHVVAVGLDAFLQVNLRRRERDMVGIAPGPAGQRLWVAGQPVAQRGGERREDAGVALAEVDAMQDGLLGITGLGGLGDLDQEGVAADLERRGVEALGLRLAPVPDGVERAEARAAQALAAADAPVIVGGRGEARGARLDLRAALLLKPVEAVELGELLREQVAQGGQVPDVEGGVVEQLGRDGPRGPVGLLAGLVDGDAEMVLEENPKKAISCPKRPFLPRL